MPNIEFSIGSQGVSVESKGRKLLEIKGDKPFALFEADLSEAAKRQLKDLDKATGSLEAMFVRDLLKEMMPKSVGGEGAWGDFTRDQFMNAIADVVGKRGGLGAGESLNAKLRDTIYRQEAARLMTQTPEETTRP